jgi:hypothetical protein
MSEMAVNNLERAVIESFLADRSFELKKSTVNFDAVKISDREFTGVGFLTEFERSVELKLFEDKFSLRWGRVGARLNTSKLETGYLIYVDGGYLTTVEGYTYGDEWPKEIEHIELYKLKLS